MIDIFIPLLPGFDDRPTLAEQLAGKPRWERPVLVEGAPPLPDVVPVEPPPPPLVEQLPGAMPIPPIVKDGSLAAFLAVVGSQVGWLEYQGNVDNPWSNWDSDYQRGPYIDGAYCGQFISWAFAAAGVEGDWKGAASQRYVPAAFWYWFANGQIVPFDQARPGDIAMLGWGDGGDLLDHTEVIVGVEFIGNGLVSTVGANTGYPEGVHWTQRDRSTVLAVARPEYVG